ncbi:phage tail protein [Marinilactibacillus kalidii]|uniref:phage tail protein n=1 Tax=Marinilactibacillus kalidii TaxID=2820274 RepID=UPI001ABDB0C9|nr:hypothetical protein [Marinilactibacillus kalidii]
MAVNILGWLDKLGADEQSASKSTEKMKKAFVEADNTISKSLSNIGKAATNFSNALSGETVNSVLAFSEALINSSAAGEGFEAFVSSINSESSEASSTINTLTQHMGKISEFGNTIGALAEKTSGISSFFEKVVQGSANLSNKLSDIPNDFKTFSDKASKSIAGLTTGSINEFKKLTGGLKNITQGSGEIFAGLIPESAKKRITAVLDSTKARFQEFGTSIKEKMSGPVQGITGVLDNAKGRFQEFGTSLKEKMSGPLESISTGITTFQSKLGSINGEGFFGMIGKSSEKLKGLLPSFEKIGTGAQTILSQGTSVVSGVVGQTIQGLMSVMGVALSLIGPGVLLAGIILGLGLLQATYGETLDQLLVLVTEKGPQIIQQLITGAEEMLPQFMLLGTNLLVSLLEAIAVNLPLLLQGGMDIISMLLEGVAASLPRIMEAMIPIVGALLQGIILALPMLLEAGLSLLQGLINGIFSNMGLIVDTITQVITTLSQVIQENLPIIIEKGISILVSLINGIVQALPQLIPLALTLFSVLVNAIFSNLPKIIEGGTRILGALIDGAIALLPMIPGMIATVFVSLIQAIAANLPSILQKGIELLGRLGTGIIQAIPALLALLPAVWNGITRVFKAVDWLSVGKNIIDGIGRGLKNAGGALWNTAKSLLGSFKDNVLGFFGIHSPSRVFRDEVGKFIPQGIAVGIDQDADEMQKSLDYAAAGLRFSPDIARNQILTPSMVGTQDDAGKTQSNGLEAIMGNLLATIQELKNQSQEINIQVDGYTIAKVMRDPLDREFGKKYKDKMQSKGRR